MMHSATILQSEEDPVFSVVWFNKLTFRTCSFLMLILSWRFLSTGGTDILYVLNSGQTPLWRHGGFFTVTMYSHF